MATKETRKTMGLSKQNNNLQPNSLYRAACLQTSNGFFCSVNHLSGGGVNANHNATHSPSLARKKQDWEWPLKWSRTAKKSRWWVEFLLRAGGRHCFILARDKNKKDHKKLRRKLFVIARNRAITSSEPWNTETNKVDRTTPITSKHVFPNRSAKMIDGTEKPQIPSKFAKRAARCNEFGYNLHVRHALSRGRFCTTTAWNVSRFMGEVNSRPQFSSFFLNLKLVL